MLPGRKTSYRAGAKCAALCAAVALTIVTACSPDLPRRYSGDLVPFAGTCDEGGRAVLDRAGSAIVFAPKEGVVTLSGRISSSGTVTAMRELPGMNHATYKLVFTGQLAGGGISGTYVTPRCRYNVQLHAVSG
jgi:hypothetical protein